MFHLPILLLLFADVPATHPLDRDAVVQAMRKTMSERPETASANIEVIDLSHFSVPNGEMEFDWKDLTPAASGQSTARWRGVVRHDSEHSFSIWAVVKITVPCKRIVATQTLRPEEPITASQIHEESYDGFPSEACNASLNSIAGKVANRTITANTTIVRAMLTAPASVLKGDQAIAEYRGGGVTLSLPVIAERSGRIGEVIPVRNPSSKKVLLAQVTGEGKVLIDSGFRTNKDKQ